MTTTATRALLGGAAAVMLGLVLGLHPLVQLGMGLVGYVLTFAVLTRRGR